MEDTSVIARTDKKLKLRLFQSLPKVTHWSSSLTLQCHCQLPRSPNPAMTSSGQTLPAAVWLHFLRAWWERPSLAFILVTTPFWSGPWSLELATQWDMLLTVRSNSHSCHSMGLRCYVCCHTHRTVSSDSSCLVQMRRLRCREGAVNRRR